MNWKQEVLRRIKPTMDEEEALHARITGFLKEVNRAGGDARAVLGGSGAKGTWLKGQHDADVFVLFPGKYKSESLADILEKRLKRLKKSFQRLHGSRDYFRVQEHNFVFEIIPILKINKAREAQNITDVSPLHAAWVKKSSEKMRDEIRIAKAFCKAQGCYGAESYIRGFSGYVLEILVIYYGSFEKLLKAAVRWEEKQVIDAGKLYKGDVWMEMNAAKLQSPLIVVDPVDKSRNAAAALSKEKWLLFKKKAAEFLKRPGVVFFEKKEVSFDKLRGNIVWVEVESHAGKEDKVGAQLLLAFEFLKKRLEDFGIVNCGWEWDQLRKGTFWFVVKKKDKERVELRRGPPVELEKHAAAFRKKHKKTVVKGGVVFAPVAVKDYRVKDAVKTAMKEVYFKEKVKRVVSSR